jgi:hypothetical protein
MSRREERRAKFQEGRMEFKEGRKDGLKKVRKGGRTERWKEGRKDGRKGGKERTQGKAARKKTKVT